MTHQVIYRTLSLLLLSLASLPAWAQTATDSTSAWKTSTSAGLTFANVGLQNWAGGGVSSISLGFVGQFKAVREKEKSVWTNQFDLAYGLQKQEGQQTMRKTDDQLILLSQYGYKLKENLLLSAMLNFRTQMDLGYKYGVDAQGGETRDIISRFMAPGYLSANIGLTYKHNNLFTVTVSPLANKNTFVMDDDLAAVGAFGVKPGDNVRAEFGASLLGNLSTKLMENVNFSTSLGLFGNYENLEAIDVNWETLLSMKINKYMNASFGTQLIYDQDVKVTRKDDTVGPAIQFKHVLNIGVGVTF